MLYGFAGVAPQALTHAASEQRVAFPDDEPQLERLMGYLDRARPKLPEIATAVCEFYLIDPAEFRRTRLAEVSMARHIFCYLAYRYTRASLPVIGRYLRLHHTSVMYAIRRIEKYIVTKPLVHDDVDLLRLRISEIILRRSFKGSA
jgi:chromosomal replication initiation ATPase DnaA